MAVTDGHSLYLCTHLQLYYLGSQTAWAHYWTIQQDSSIYESHPILFWLIAVTDPWIMMIHCRLLSWNCCFVTSYMVASQEQNNRVELMHWCSLFFTKVMMSSFCHTSERATSCFCTKLLSITASVCPCQGGPQAGACCKLALTTTTNY